MALIDALIAVAHSKCFHLKWPNDVIVDGAKLAGLLLETRAVKDKQAVVIGWGVNISEVPENLPYRAIGLQSIASSLDLGQLRQELMKAFMERLSQWKRGENFAAIRALWLQFALPPGTPLMIRGSGAEKYEGVFESIDADGSLLLKTPHRNQARDCGRRYPPGGGMTKQLYFVPLGGVGEIGMNLALYGYGAPGNMQWLLVDCGVTFADAKSPGIELIMPDIRFIADDRQAILGFMLTHGHEDHIGAVLSLYPQLNCKIFATKFTAGLLAAKAAEDGRRRAKYYRDQDRQHGKLRPVRGDLSFGGAFDSRKVMRSASSRRRAAFSTPATGKSIPRRRSAMRPTWTPLPNLPPMALMY